MKHFRKSTIISSLFLALWMASNTSAASVEKRSYGVTADGRAVDQFTLSNSQGASVEIITLGATLTKLSVPDNHRKFQDVVLGFDNLKGYEKNSPYFGAIIGRVANRIAGGKYSVDGIEYRAAANSGPNSLHGGRIGYDKRIWNAQDATTKEGAAVRLTLIDPDGTEGYPGTVKVAVTYTLTADNTLRIEYTATTDKATPINLTNHTYWNLRDGGKSSVDDGILKIYADRYTPADATLIPTGEIAPVKGTPLDFTSSKPIGEDIEAIAGKVGGYDHNLVLRNQTGKLAKALELYEPNTGRVMEMWTTEPGVQIYTANGFNGTLKGKSSTAYTKHCAVAFEAQHYPDSVNQPKFPSVILRPGETYHQLTEYRFSAVSPVEPF